MAPLHYAAYEGNAAAIRMLVAAGAEVDVRDEDTFPMGAGCTPLFYAMSSGHYDASSALLELGADIYGASLSAPPITHYVAAGHYMEDVDSIKILHLLLENGCDVNRLAGGRHFSLFGTSMLFCASFYGKLESVRLLLEHRANPMQVCGEGAHQGRTPLSAARDQMHWSIVALLEDAANRAD